MAAACIFSIVISKLGYWQKFCPVILFKFDKSLEVSFYHTILTFGLAIYLKMKSCRKFLFDSEKVAEQ